MMMMMMIMMMMIVLSDSTKFGSLWKYAFDPNDA
jgi:hypothetical protein